MGKQEKLKAKLLTRPKDFTWSELESVLSNLGFELLKGKGSRRKFFHKDKNILINLHEPHPDKILKRYVVEQVLEKLVELGECNE
ncbi:type II toxin-antitoxin system HicA family toxin [Vibrio cholerae]|uniref:type II toxin-antitoxin system HicA family toxin n=1 Tax=Vibrio cholerae TaxID=666 RepID=UPI001DF5B9F4|nr:type II toxin-antitoxin system HicA family toxin [Vibrio cholerae]EJL6486937.1 type II toxin-antitoxin system HicA family toxin [Vibrio cholerae]MCR9871832.1 type II toxin-antitoxin system HicA family toxin [Vibrio cholerae]MVC34259.1 type II toxin-antitoxin system HicA family toxin [Vibrio cholerae]